MKNWKRYAAIVGIVIVLVCAMLPFLFSLGSGETAESLFRGSVAAAFFLPVIAYAMVLAAKMVKGGRRELPKDQDIDTVIFDVGRVLVRFDWRSYLKEFNFPDKTAEAVANAVFLSEHWVERDLGILSDEEILDRMIGEAPEFEQEIRDVFRDSYRTVSGLDYAETWVRYLKERGYHTYILSNYPEGILRKTRHLIPVDLMDGAIFSCEVHAIKPYPEIYSILLERYGIDPERAVFIDDRQENLDGAAALGIRTILFRDLTQAAEELKKLGIE